MNTKILISFTRETVFARIIRTCGSHLPTVVLIILLSFNFCLLSSQVPQGFNYMAIARNEAGEVLANHELSIRIAILSGIPLEYDLVWEEEHLVTTNDNGLFRLRVGDPDATPVGGGKAHDFSEIDWTVQPLSIRTSILIKGEWQIMGEEALLLSVPYANLAQSAYNAESADVATSAYSLIGSPFTVNADSVYFSRSVGVGATNLHKAKLAVMGDNTASEDALFEVKRKDGKTMFAVYNQGVRINVPMDDLVKGATKGGFAIGGFDGLKGNTHDLFYLNKDSVRIYLDKTPDLTKGTVKGGFAIGGFDYTGKTSDPVQEYLSVTPDSTRIYVKEPTGKGATKGGFAIGGFDGTGKGYTGKYLDLTKNNYFIGQGSGSNIPETGGGLYNSVIGYQAGKSLTTGGSNTILGHLAGTNLTGGNRNIIIGEEAGYSLTGTPDVEGISNTIIGYQAGYYHTTQLYNVMIGNAAGFHLNQPGWSGSFNTFMGTSAGYAIRNSRDNTFLGTNAGLFLDNGTGNTFVGTDAGRSGPDPGTWVPRAFTADHNTFIGDESGYNITTGYNNAAIGYHSGYSVSTGYGNVFIGANAGASETGNNKLYIANSSSSPLIYGDFTSGNVGIGTTTIPKKLNVSGDVGVSGNIAAGSFTGDVTGNVSGSAGSVGGVTIGKIYLSAAGDVLTTFTSAYKLYWNKSTGEIYIYNYSTTEKCEYWYRTAAGASASGSLAAGGSASTFISGIGFTDGVGVEVHFGSAHGTQGWCSVWLQYGNGCLVGHYMKY